MPRQNRVTPGSEIIAAPGRGLFMGNRGILHGGDGRLGRARWKSRAWICCLLSFKNRRLALMEPGHYTQLFFLDEAVAFAAGHRPCAECRRADYNRFRAAWAAAGMGQSPKAPEIDACLHKARLDPETRRQCLHRADFAALPDGTFVRRAGQDWLVQGQRLFPYAPDGYGAPRPRPAAGPATVLTPAPLIAVLAAGYAPVLHPSAA